MINVALIEEINGLTKKLINDLKEEIDNSTKDKLDEGKHEKIVPHKITGTFPNTNSTITNKWVEAEKKRKEQEVESDKVYSNSYMIGVDIAAMFNAMINNGVRKDDAYNLIDSYYSGVFSNVKSPSNLP